MIKYNIPARAFANGPKKLVSWRVPKELMLKLDEVANKKGRTVSDIVITVLDQFLQEESNEKQPSKK